MGLIGVSYYLLIFGFFYNFIILYVLVYTPLKRISPMLVGAPRSHSIYVGLAAATNDLILSLEYYFDTVIWQFPTFGQLLGL